MPSPSDATRTTTRPSGRIELRLRTLDQLFDSFDPAPFHEKDMRRIYENLARMHVEVLYTDGP